MTGAPRTRVTLKEQVRISEWMLKDTETTAQMTPADLAASIHADLGIVMSDGSAARHRRALGITAPKRTKRTGTASLRGLVADLQDQVLGLTQRLDAAGL